MSRNSRRNSAKKEEGLKVTDENIQEVAQQPEEQQEQEVSQLDTQEVPEVPEVQQKPEETQEPSGLQTNDPAEKATDEDKCSTTVKAAIENINNFFKYIVGERSFHSEAEKKKAVVSFSNQIVRTSKFSDEDFKDITDFLISRLGELIKDHKMKIDHLNRFNIVLAREQTVNLEKSNIYMAAIFKIARNYSTRKQIAQSIDWTIVCKGRTESEVQRVNNYFRNLINK